MITFESANELVSRVRDNLSSYDTADLLDEGRFYYWIKEGLEDLGLDNADAIEEVHFLTKDTLAFPKGMAELYAIYELQDLHVPINRPFNERFRVVDVMRYGHHHGAKPILSRRSPCRRGSGNIFTASKNHFHFPFKDRPVLVQYQKLSIEDELPQIPEHAIFQKYFERKIIFELFKYFWYNSTVADIVQKMQFAEREYEVARADAIYYKKLPEFRQLLSWKRTQRDNFKAYEINRFH